MAGDTAAVRRLAAVHDRSRQRRAAGVFEALPERLISAAGRHGMVDLSPLITP
ncbi:hypothetical protein ABZ719_09695 [Streptomyces sp. NPDC006743]|uniref:hypothetical protein n=1 Tax=Streptomyces sp. NPDC006743 TaxID=3154480 RepID=UPI003453CEC5